MIQNPDIRDKMQLEMLDYGHFVWKANYKVN